MHTLTPIMLAIVLSLCCEMAAGDLISIPKQGTAIYVTYYTGLALANLDMSDTGHALLIELFGTTRNMDDQKLFNDMSVHCLCYRVAGSGEVGGAGACTMTDSDGDQVYTTFDATAQAHTLIGGSGKYKGISGAAPYTAPGPGLSWGSSVAKLTWQFR